MLVTVVRVIVFRPACPRSELTCIIDWIRWSKHSKEYADNVQLGHTMDQGVASRCRGDTLVPTPCRSSIRQYSSDVTCSCACYIAYVAVPAT